MRTVLCVAVIGGVIPWTLFTVHYAATRPFWRSKYGRNLFCMGASLALLLGAFAWSYWVGRIPLPLWIALATSIAAVGWHRYYLLLHTPPERQH